MDSGRERVVRSAGASSRYSRGRRSGRLCSSIFWVRDFLVGSSSDMVSGASSMAISISGFSAFAIGATFLEASSSSFSSISGALLRFRFLFDSACFFSARARSCLALRSVARTLQKC